MALSTEICTHSCTGLMQGCKCCAWQKATRQGWMHLPVFQSLRMYVCTSKTLPRHTLPCFKHHESYVHQDRMHPSRSSPRRSAGTAAQQIPQGCRPLPQGQNSPRATQPAFLSSRAGPWPAPGRGGAGEPADPAAAGKLPCARGLQDVAKVLTGSDRPHLVMGWDPADGTRESSMRWDAGYRIWLV